MKAGMNFALVQGRRTYWLWGVLLFGLCAMKSVENTLQQKKADLQTQSFLQFTDVTNGPVLSIPANALYHFLQMVRVSLPKGVVLSDIEWKQNKVVLRGQAQVLEPVQDWFREFQGSQWGKSASLHTAEDEMNAAFSFEIKLSVPGLYS